LIQDTLMRYVRRTSFLARTLAAKHERKTAAGRRVRRRLVIEPLEIRALLNATMIAEGGLAALPSAEGVFGSPAFERPVRVGNREIDRAGNEAYILPVPDAQFTVSTAEFTAPTAAGAEAAALPLADTFFLHSYPSASKTIYLDFDGHVTTGTFWNTSYYGGKAITTPAFSLDADSLFSDTELERIQNIWQRVAEDFRPFAVNVTTQDPGPDALRKAGSGDSAWGIRVAIGGSSTDWFSTSGAGGVAYMNSFNWDSDTPAFVFPKNLSNAEKYVAEAISHEIGHTLGLRHDGTTAGVEYYAGHGSGATGWAPIPGNGYYKELTQWSKGEYPGAGNTEDDLAIITTANGFGYRPDDHGNQQAAATALHSPSGTILAGEGIIERNTDRDYFSFTTGNGTVSLTINPSQRGPNLDILATLYDGAANVIATSNPLDRLDASLSINLLAGTYYLAIEGTGKAPLTTGYSGYASLGYYSIAGTIPLFDEPPFVAGVDPANETVIGSRNASIDVTFSEPVVGVDPGDMVLSGPAAATASVGTPLDLGGNTWRFPIYDLVDGALEIQLASNPDDIQDAAGNGLAPSPTLFTYFVAVRNVGATIAPTSGLVTTEAGGTATFTIVLDAAPLADVTVELSSSDPSEGVVSPASVTFTPSNWSATQMVTVTGMDDAVADGDISYTIITAAAVSDDEAYQGFDFDDVSVTNLDDDLPTVSAGHHILLPDTPGQIVAVYVAGGAPVSGLKFFAKISSSDPESGGSVQGPQIQSVNLTGHPEVPTIFTGNNDGQRDAGSLPRVQAWEIATAAGTVGAQGLLATLTIDTTGWWKNSAAALDWPLLLADAQLDSTHFFNAEGNRINAAIVAGAITLNTPPLALASSVSTAEDEPYAFSAEDFGFWDADTGDGLTAVRITSLPAPGVLEFDAAPVSVDQEFSVADLMAGKLQFRPARDAHGAAYATFEFTVHDGMQGSPSSAAMTIDVTPVNDPPMGDDQWLSVLENGSTPVTLTGSDVDGDELEFSIVDAPAHGVLSGIAPHLWYTPPADFRGTDSFTFISRDGWEDSPPATVTISVISAPDVVGRYVFYNDSAWDGYDAAADPNDDAAIAPDKQALLPGQVAGFEHYTSYVRGLNGLMVDIAHLAPDMTLTAADFQFLARNGDDLAAWTTAPYPASIMLRPNAGVGGSTRVTLIWADQDAVRNQWLQVTLRANANTNLVRDDVFYFGNAIGESGLGNANSSLATEFFPVNVTDEIGTRNHPLPLAGSAPLDDAFDFNRDAMVDTTDEAIARDYGTTFRTALRRIAPPPADPEPTPTAEQGTEPLFIVIGSYVLQPNTPGQQIPIYVSGEWPVAGLNFNIQVGEARLTSTVPSAPVIERADILTGTIFAANHTGLRTGVPAQGDVLVVPQHEYQATTTASGTVIAEGLLATVTIDTTGFHAGSWSLVMSSTVNGPTDFAGVAATIVDGSIILSQTWRNPVNPRDVDGNGRVSPLDALIVISHLNSQFGDSTLPFTPEAPPPYYDVNGDDRCSAADVLMIVNYINAQEASRSGEAEADLRASEAATAAVPPPAWDTSRTLGGSGRAFERSTDCPGEMSYAKLPQKAFSARQAVRSPQAGPTRASTGNPDEQPFVSDELESILSVISRDEGRVQS